MLTVMIVDDDAQRAGKLQEAFHSQGYRVAELVQSAFALPGAVAKCAPDVIIIGADSPNRDMLEHLCVATRDCRLVARFRLCGRGGGSLLGRKPQVKGQSNGSNQNLEPLMFTFTFFSFHFDLRCLTV